MSVDIRLANEIPKMIDYNALANTPISLQLVSPGDIITSEPGYMRGHGTYMKSNMLCASVAGLVRRVNRLISVVPINRKYQGEIGDVVVGRICEVQRKRWKVETNSRLDSNLMLSSVNLPGGELRRRSAEDELAMRNYLNEGDLISAEVQSVMIDGLSLHTRSLKYGKLSQGTLVTISPNLIKRQKSHFHEFPFGASVIFGNNGFIWISSTQEKTSSSATQIPRSDREVISRLRNCIVVLAAARLMLWDTSLIHAYNISAEKYEVSELLKPDVAKDLADMTRQQLVADEQQI